MRAPYQPPACTSIARLRAACHPVRQRRTSGLADRSDPGEAAVQSVPVVAPPSMSGRGLPASKLARSIPRRRARKSRPSSSVGQSSCLVNSRSSVRIRSRAPLHLPGNTLTDLVDTEMSLDSVIGSVQTTGGGSQVWATVRKTSTCQNRKWRHKGGTRMLEKSSCAGGTVRHGQAMLPRFRHLRCRWPFILSQSESVSIPTTCCT